MMKERAVQGVDPGLARDGMMHLLAHYDSALHILCILRGPRSLHWSIYAGVLKPSKYQGVRIRARGNVRVPFCSNAFFFFLLLAR